MKSHKKKEKQEKTKNMLTKIIIIHQHVTNNFFEVNLKRNCDVFFSKNMVLGKNTIKIAMVTKVGVLTKDCILHLSYMYWFIKYQNYILM